MNILVVDDSKLYRDTFSKKLSEYGTVKSSADGVDALRVFHLAHARNEPYELISLDINMEPISGIQVLKSIREWEKISNTNNITKIIVQSSQDNIKNIMKIYDMGCQVFLRKPVKETALEEGLKKLNIVKIPTINLDF
jgi:CheY-like chemotaxis protein